MSGCTCKPVYKISKPRRNYAQGIPEEWVTVVRKNGKRDEGKTGYTDDKDDAFGTYGLQKKWIDQENARLCKCGRK